ncbi:MAG TPA: YggS family pyridoxal phosphate enzyme [Solirubrobacteraceae bacterium]|nr:YggS family pyridoxal phosphate enzyme [Solirubrobacteraceae bacterium]
MAGLSAERVAANLAEVRGEIAAAAQRAGRSADAVEVLAAVKYLDAEALGALAEAGITLLGENRAQELVAKADRWPGRFQWDFIGQLQSRKVKQVLPYVRLIESVATDSALRQLERHGGPDTEILVEVNLGGEASKSGIAPDELDAFLERAPVRVAGLMTMPPFTEDPEGSRPYFARLRELAAERGLERLSMGTTQDFAVAVEEGATTVRLGTRLWRDDEPE